MMAAGCTAPTHTQENMPLPPVMESALVKRQHDAIVQLMEKWLVSQEERLSQLLVNYMEPKPATWMSQEMEPSPSKVSRQGRVPSKPGISRAATVSEGDMNGIYSENMDKEPSITSTDVPATIASRKSVAHPSKMALEVSERIQDWKKGGASEVAWTCSNLCKRIVAHPCFEPFFGLLILFNAVLTAAEVEVSLHAPTDDSPAYFAIMGHLLGTLFLVELLVRVAAFRRDFLRGPQSNWNYFDSFLVTSWCIEFIAEFIGSATGSTGTADSGLSNMRLFRILRITRMFRLLRVSRLLRFVRALNLLILSILTTMRSLVWATGLMLLVIFTFAIFICQSVAEFMRVCGNEECDLDPDVKKYWGTLPIASLSLFQMITGGDDWGNMARPLMRISGILLAVLIVFIIFTQFAVLNVVTGVFCQAAVEAAQKDRELMVQSMLNDKEQFMAAISEQFTQMFMNFGEGELTAETFEEHVNTKAVHEYFAMLELDTSDAWMLFQLLDDDGSGTIDIEEFVDGCLRLKGTARSIDLAKLSNEVKQNSQKFHEDLDKLRDQLGDVLRPLDRQSKRPLAPASRSFTSSMNLNTHLRGQGSRQPSKEQPSPPWPRDDELLPGVLPPAEVG
eukprot:TRINITY_DN25464_c0_g1_i2.p1 TRINITY_DN25464_c0_g1~~TRINITY_DN25464_c0_g1_i2.p1  ORF type:complete len:619 (+),score=115.88 TRINITY_DN25464_c0_g1_i2:232-2088(+)